MPTGGGTYLLTIWRSSLCFWWTVFISLSFSTIIWKSWRLWASLLSSCWPFSVFPSEISASISSLLCSKTSAACLMVCQFAENLDILTSGQNIETAYGIQIGSSCFWTSPFGKKKKTWDLPFRWFQGWFWHHLLLLPNLHRFAPKPSESPWWVCCG